jgi:hypothetical protein
MCFKCFRHVVAVHYENHSFVKFNALGEKLKDIYAWAKAEEQTCVKGPTDVAEEGQSEPAMPTGVKSGLSTGDGETS